MKSSYYAAVTIASTLMLATSPVSAKMMSCTASNMAQSVTMAPSMPEGPGKMAMMKEMSMANTAMSKGDMRGACKSYMRAQQMSMKK